MSNLALAPRLSLSYLSQLYQSGAASAEQVFDVIAKRMASEASTSRNIWIRPLSRDEIQGYLDKAPKSGPLYGIPFAIKDNIDLAGVPTTAGCPGYAYTPESSAAVVQLLLDAGAIPVGKTNLDQFATGLVGTRSPYGPCGNSYDATLISGGSSSGSSVSVAMGMAAFSLGTDTAGSGRVPAALNGLYGWKPSRGLLSTRGVVPACASLDCVSVFAQSASDVLALKSVVSVFDDADPFAARIAPDNGGTGKIAVPKADQLSWRGKGNYEPVFHEAVERLRALGFAVETIDAQNFFDAALLLYEGPWIAERYAAVGEFIESHEADTFPVTAKIILGGKSPLAHDAFKAAYKMARFRRVAEAVFESYDALLLPTVGGYFTIEEEMADPVAINSYLGTYTNFANLLETSAIAFPMAPIDGDVPALGGTLFGPAGADERMVHLAGELQAGLDTVPVAVCGAHLSGMPLNHQLLSAGATLREATTTSKAYRFYALADTTPPKPGLVRAAQAQEGAGIALEVWHVPRQTLGAFLAAIPAPLGLGKVELASGEWVTGFTCDPTALDRATDITAVGNWRDYQSSL